MKALIIVAALILAVGNGCSTGSEPSSQGRGAMLWPLCPGEDSGRLCRWDASVQGNGQGTSFYRDARGNLHRP